MKAASHMLIAGEASGDLLAAELVRALRATPGGATARYFGAGGPRMAEAGVELAFDMTQHSVIGFWEAIQQYGKFKRLGDALLSLALERRPDLLVCVDFSGFNRRFAAVLRWECRVRAAELAGWRPRLVQFVSPQVWASRPGRARTLERDLDLLLTIFPFEKQWYAEHTPALRVEFVGHPMLDRFQSPGPASGPRPEVPLVLLLPGSRTGELDRHLPPMLEAAVQMHQARKVRFVAVLPSQALADRAGATARRAGAIQDSGTAIEYQVGGLPEWLARADLALASTGTVTMECAFFRVPTVTLYRTSWSTYQIGRRIITVKSLTMPNLLAGETVFPEFIQDEATGSNLARAALELLGNEPQRAAIRAKLDQVIASLGGPGAPRRAAEAIGRIL